MARVTREQREAWLEAARAQKRGGRAQAAARVAKSIGPNKAAGHKGGIMRQGSKRG